MGSLSPAECDNTFNYKDIDMSSRGVNKVILVGNVGKDPETRYTPQGAAVCNLALATSESWKDKNTGQPMEKTEWHRVVFFNRLAEIVNEYVFKGSKLYIEGSLRTRSWEQDGVTKYATEIVAHEMQMLDSRQAGSGTDDQYGHDDQYEPPQGRQAARPAAPAQQQRQPARQAQPARQPPRQQQSASRPVNHNPPPSDFDNFDDDIPF